MLKIVTVVGARPQIIKAAAISRAIREKYSARIKEYIVHTGQHYDENMSQVFFNEMGIPAPHRNLNVGSGSHGKQTAAMIEGIEQILIEEKPDALILYGDTNSTLAGAIAASKLHVPVVHIEAGLRSFSKKMPEEINRIMCDHASTLLFSPTKTGFRNLVKEGFKRNARPPFHADNPMIRHCGDVMYDNSLHFAKIAAERSKILQQNSLAQGGFLLGTIHRNNNTDEPARLNAIFSAILTISEKEQKPFVLPLHPRTSKLLEQNLEPKLYSNLKASRLIRILPPASFLDMIALEMNCSMILTDSGGVQKEAFFFFKPCIILRSETEWIELVKCGAAIIADANEKKILRAYLHFKKTKKLKFPALFGNGRASEFICGEMLKHLS